MFIVTERDIHKILEDYGIKNKDFKYSELQRYHYEETDPESKQVRVIIRVDIADGESFVIRFKNELDAPLEIIEAQSRFAAVLYHHGIETPFAFKADGSYANPYCISGYEVIVTVETFAEGEIKTVDAETAEKTWQLLGKMHNTAEQNDCHVKSSVLIDPLDINDLFSFTDFNKHKEKLISIDQDLFNTIVKEYEHLLKQLEPFGNEPRYAVQGDISDCNLYRTKDDRIGIFDFNRCGDNSLYFDALMQAIFEARLMDYPHELSSHQEHIILSAFLKGYQKERPFTNKQKEAFSSLYALVSAFWLADIRWNENSLENCIASNDSEGIHQWMKEIYKRELFVLPFQE